MKDKTGKLLQKAKQAIEAAEILLKNAKYNFAAEDYLRSQNSSKR